MPKRRFIIPLCAGILLAACSSEAAKQAAIITDACVELGDDKALCSCLADSMTASLDEETLTTFTSYMTSLVAADDDEARNVIAMSAFQNPALAAGIDEGVRAGRSCERIIASQVSDDDASATTGGDLAGTWVPQLGDVPVSERRLAAAAADRRWEFSADGKVTTFNQGGPRKWTYQVRGKEILLRGADSRTQGERRRFTYTRDGNCIWDGSGNSSVDMRFCRQ